MLALIAAAAFFLALFQGEVEDVRLIPFGLLCLALHQALGHLLPWPRRQPPA